MNKYKILAYNSTGKLMESWEFTARTTGGVKKLNKSKFKEYKEKGYDIKFEVIADGQEDN